MKKDMNYTVLGISVVSICTIMIAFFFWLATDKSGIGSYNTYSLTTSESVSGLLPDSPVLFSGVKVGYVSSIKIDKVNPDKVDIIIRVDKTIPIYASTVATLNSQGITGVVYIALKAKTKTKKLLKQVAGEAYPRIPVEKSLLSQLSNLVPTVTENLTKSMQGIQRILSKGNTDNVSKILKNVQTVTASVSADQHKVINNLNLTLASINTATKTIDKSAQMLNRSIASSNVMLNSVTQQTLPDLTKLLSDLNTVSANFKVLSREVKRNPSIVIRGVVPAQLGPGEK